LIYQQNDNIGFYFDTVRQNFNMAFMFCHKMYIYTCAKIHEVPCFFAFILEFFTIFFNRLRAWIFSFS